MSEKKYSGLDVYTKYRRFLMFFMSIAILFLHTALFSYVWDRFYSNVIVQPFFNKGNWLIVIVYAVVLFVFSKVYSGYEVGILRISEIIYSQTLAIIFTNIVTYIEICLIGRMFMWGLPVVIMSIAQICMVILWSCFSNRLYYRVFAARRMILVYGSHSATSLVKKMSKRYDKYIICSAVSTEENISVIKEKISDYSSVILCDVKSGLRNQLLKYCYERSIRVYLTPKISDIIVGGASKIRLFDTPLYSCRGSGLTLDQRFMKRVTDLFFAGILALFASPFMIIIAVCIKLYDRGPVIYKQERLTRDGRHFNVYKFRSMIVDAEKNGVARFASKEDDRITPVGKVIRKLRLDELPQIFNILNGSMSIVGPRPERPEIAEQFKEELPEFDFRLKVKAGLTGYAQILGKYNTLPYDKLKMDLMYIENYSILLDFKLMLMTIKILFIADSTEGIEEGHITPNEDREK